MNDKKLSIRQNDIWFVDMGSDGAIGHEQMGTRPFYVISNTKYNSVSDTPVGFFLSTSSKKKANRFTYDVNMQGVEENVNVSQIRTISSKRFIKKIGYGSMYDTKKLLKLFMEQIVQVD